MSIPEYEAEAFRGMLEEGRLPRPYSEHDSRALRKAGVRLRGQGLLLQAALPPGWQAVQTEARWGQLVDDQGRIRARFFYKGAPYDRKGHTQMRPRYSTFSGRPGNDNWCVWDYSTDTVLFEAPADSDSSYDQAKAWLNAHFPGWQDPSCYWDDPVPDRDGPTPGRRWWQFRNK